ncbi:MAG: winged helix-turn-helix domain-containing protein [Terriglobales bacterium]
MDNPLVLRFARFEFDLRAGVLRRDGAAVHLQDKPLRLLEILLARPGQLVTRAELQQALWPGQDFGEFDDGLNTAMRKLREALEDDAQQPGCIATVPRRGYRWIAALEPVAAAPAPASTSRPSHPASDAARLRRRWWWAVAAVIAVAGGAVVLLPSRPVFSYGPRAKVLLLPVANSTGQPRLGAALDTAFAVSLERSKRFILFPRDRIPGQLQLLGRARDSFLTPSLGRQICRREGLAALIVPAITRTGREYALTAEVIAPASGAVRASHMERADGSDHILDALGALARDLRRDGGASLYGALRGGPPLPEVTTPSLTALGDYAEGEARWRNGHFAAAVRLYRAALLADPGFAMAHAALAAADCSYIYYDEAGCRAEYALALAHPERVTKRERLLIQSHRADDLAEVETAIALYQNYLRAYPEDWEVLNDYAHLLRRHGREARAIPIYHRLLAVAPNDARTYIELATAEMSSGDYPASLAAYRQAFRLNPHWELAGDTNREYGFTLLRAGHPRRAAAAFGELLRIPALRPIGLVSLARLDFWRGRLARAEAMIQEAMRAPAPPDPLATARRHLLLGQIALARGDRAGGLRELRTSVGHLDQIGPKVLWGTLAGTELARAGDPAAATRLLERIAPLVHPRDYEETGALRLLRGEIACAEGRGAEAVAIIGQPDPDDGSAVDALATEARAHAAWRAGDFARAARWYRRVLGPTDSYIGWEPQPRKQVAYLDLARSELALGHRAAAQAALTSLLRLLAGADPDLVLRRQALALAAELR